MSSPNDLSPLSPNAIDDISSLPDGKITLTAQPLIQILSIRSTTASRFRLVISDGIHFMQAVLAERLAESLGAILNVQSLKNSIAALEVVSWFPVHNVIPGHHHVLRLLVIEELHFVEDRTQRIGQPVSHPKPLRPSP
ncbi:hypothetical protein FB45DRAFT_1035717 [Roridomyces roridus]|uniref:Replication factor-A protein 1 N-terminal domain-containing protein n=1 Tax=Roridomyces roridus TaxID=1738132 RepID=A0AAD7FF45_9AGAR|nr:hypothetical protein FB45DRAFT_1035717 [Roridomyces roridus]